MNKEVIAWHAMNAIDVLHDVGGRLDGLQQSDIEKQREVYGSNKQKQATGIAWYSILLRQLTGPLIIILIIATGITFFLEEYFDALVIGIAIILNTALGFVEEYKADRAVQKLQNYLPVEAAVLRDGKELRIPAADIVVGDILLLRAGDRITADARILRSDHVEVDEAALTGESVPVQKHANPLPAEMGSSDRVNMVFAGTTVTAGSGHAVVIAVGEHTQIGRISALVGEAEEMETPLEQQLSRLARWIGGTVLVLTGLLFLIGILQGRSAAEMLYVSVAVAVAAVPEGLVIALTIILAISMQRILKRKALVRKLVAAETLGSVSVICMDKTGTITTGNMAVTESYPLKGTTSQMQMDIALNMIPTVTVHQDDPHTYIGSPTDIALYSYGRREQKESMGIKHASLPFDSRYKYTAAIIESDSGEGLYVIGAPDILLQKSDMNDADRRKATDKLESLSADGRVIAVAMKDMRLREIDHDDINDLTLLGFVLLQDPIREDSEASVQAAKEAGLRPVMITGDHPNTAYAVGQSVGLCDADCGKVITGNDIEDMTDAELSQSVVSTSIFARVLPEHKLRIVKAWHANGASVAMTGDGVNDAPALKSADIGIAVGSGTEVAKQASDMILLDNSLHTIISAIREGRIIFDNVRKVVTYLLMNSFTEIALIMGSLLFALPLPLLPIHILWINLAADSFPAIALAFEPGEKGIMQEKPRRRDERILNVELKVMIFGVAAFTSVSLLVLFMVLLQDTEGIAHVRTVIFFTLAAASLFYVFAVRTIRTSIFRTNPFSNPWLVLSVLFGIALQVSTLFIPFLRSAFQLTPIYAWEWAIIAGVSVTQFAIIELVKEIYHRRQS